MGDSGLLHPIFMESLEIHLQELFAVSVVDGQRGAFQGVMAAVFMRLEAVESALVSHSCGAVASKSQGFDAPGMLAEIQTLPRGSSVGCGVT